MREEIARRNPESPADWTEAYRRIHGQMMSLTPALRDLYDDPHPVVVVQKGAQVGISEWMLNVALYGADRLVGGRGNVLYVMPTEAMMHDFVQGRLDPAIASSPYLAERTRPDPPAKTIDRARMKRIGNGYVYLRGSEPTQLSSVDADAVLLDEYDLMDEGALPLARQRLASSRARLLRVASTPRYPEAGVNRLFLRSDQRYYWIPCEDCGLVQRLEWEQNVDRARGLLVCRDCRWPIDIFALGEWRAAAPSHTDIHGYHLSRLYSPFANVPALVREADEAQTPTESQQFQNQVLGEVYVPRTGGLTLQDLDNCRRNYTFADYSGEETVIGVDVGNVFHVVVRGRTTKRLWAAAMVPDVAALTRLIERFNVQMAVVDSQPDFHTVRQLAAEHPRRVVLADYARHQSGHDWFRDPESGRRVHVNRTEALDSMIHRFQSREVSLPKDGRQVGGRVKDGQGEYYREMGAIRSSLVQDQDGNWERRWLSPTRADHFAHAETYCMLAEAPGPWRGERKPGWILGVYTV